MDTHPTTVPPPIARTAPVERMAYTPREAAAALGISRRSLDRAVARGDLRAARIGGAVRIPRAELDRLLGVEPAREASR